MKSADESNSGSETPSPKSAEDGEEAVRKRAQVKGSSAVLCARLAIIALFAVSVSLLTIFAWLWTDKSTLNAVNSVGDSLRNDIMNRSVAHFVRILSDQSAALQVTEQAAYYQYELTGDVLGDTMRRQVWGVVGNLNYDLTCSTHLASARFQYLNPNTTNGRSYLEIFSNTGAPAGRAPISYQTQLDDNGNRIGPVTIFNTDIDFRLREYYVQAESLPAGQVYWSLLYSALSFPVMTASTALTSNITGEVLGVNVVSQELNSVSNYMSMWDLRGGTLFFVTEDNVLMASSGPNTDFVNNSELGPRLRRANESNSNLIRDADAYVMRTWGMQHLLANASEGYDIHLDGKHYYVNTLPLTMGNLQAVAIMAIPRASIVGSIDSRRHATIIFLVSLASSIFLLGCVLVFCFTARVSSEVKLKAELDAAKRKAEAHSQAKSMFLSNVSHELRTPMAGIMGLLDLLLADELLPEQAVNVAQIRQCATSLLGLLNNLLDLGKIEAGRLELESADFDLVGELESLVDMFAVQCGNKGVEIGLELPAEITRLVKGDQARFRQIVANLLSNAVKFSSEGGHVVVRAWPTPLCETSLARAPSGNVVLESSADGPFAFAKKGSQSGPLVSDGHQRFTFEVEDTGIGIPPEKREKVFENFVQADSSTTRLHGGTGLGLGIVRSLVRMMGGDIRVVDKQGSGTLMRFEVCFNEAQDQPVAATPEIEGRGRHVLLGMPGDLGRSIAERHLSGLGFNVHPLQKWDDVIAAARGLSACTGASDASLPIKNHADVSRASDGGHVAVDIDGLLDGRGSEADSLLLVLDANLCRDMQELEDCVSRLSKLQERMVVAWLVSSETPAPIRQLLKSSFLIANKPLYASRLSELVRAMASPQGECNKITTPSEEPQFLARDTSQLNHLGAESILALDQIKISPRNYRSLMQDAAAQEVTSSSNRSTSSSSLFSSSSNASTALEFDLQQFREAAKQTSDVKKEAGVPFEPLAGMRVLVAEDTPILQKLAVKMLTKLGASVEAVSDGQLAFEAVVFAPKAQTAAKDGRSNTFDVVLMDCQMPNMDGFQATKAIRQAEASTGRHTPIIALTAHAMASDKVKCLSAGMDGYLSKPINQKELIATLKLVVSQREAKPVVD